MRAIRYVREGAGRYVVGDIEPFDQKNQMFSRAYWQREFEHLQIEKREALRKLDARMGYRLQDESLKTASWLIEHRYAGGEVGGTGLYAWHPETRPAFLEMHAHLKDLVRDPQQNAREVKKASRLFGAHAAGICELDRRWLYSHSFNQRAEESSRSKKIEIPDEYGWVVVLALEMDYEAMRCSPGRPASAASGLGYSKMAYVAGMVAEYIRGLGFQAIPSGNDTGCSIPMAIDAGLGELARNGLLITPKCGPRVRLAKVFTDLPLAPDKPIAFGVWEFCRVCKKCAQKCPSKSIPLGEPTDEIHNISNRSGLRRWPVNGETCLAFWKTNGSDCSVCVRSCPFNKPPGWFHDLTRLGISHFPLFNRFYLLGDDILRYGTKRNVEDYWHK